MINSKKKKKRDFKANVILQLRWDCLVKNNQIKKIVLVGIG